MGYDITTLPSDDGELRDRLQRAVIRFCPPWLSGQLDDIVQIAWLRLAHARNARGQALAGEAAAQVGHAPEDQVLGPAQRPAQCKHGSSVGSRMPTPGSRDT